MADSDAAAFIRDIHVSGHHRMAMADLRSVVGAAGFEAISTLGQTGNLLLRPGRNRGTSSKAAWSGRSRCAGDGMLR